ncbi:MAG: Threonylcarbamoyladenosine tRNA methylthiotransferase MtaB [Phycisphaerae bacterium]|nr:Threonylcarbamoyladenosine tRNA methylthiotransferase MtaB [Phycisphaerae bacterium]
MFNKYQLLTLGCKVNQYESQTLRELLDASGMIPAADGERPDLAIVNTCAVTGQASRKSRQTVRKIVGRGRTRVVVVGCAATDAPDAFRAIPGVEAVVGHQQDVTETLIRLLERLRRGNPPRAGVDAHTDPVHVVRAAPPRQTDERDDRLISPISVRELTRPETSQQLPTRTNKTIPLDRHYVKARFPLVTKIHRFEGHRRAFLKVQDGCDAHCTYCIIPRLRGTPRSKPEHVVLDEARALVAAGYREIVLTGIYLGAFGRETAVRKRFASADSPLARLVCAVAKITGLLRLRLSSLEPGDLDESLLDALQSSKVCVPHLHLPLQSGSVDILRQMNRQYSVEDFLETTRRVRTALDRPAITTDVVVGFPGEQDADFEATLTVARQAGFCDIHAFPFSPRRQTPAARWSDRFVPSSVVDERLTRLAGLKSELSLAFRRRFLGQTERVIVESGSPRLDVVADESNDLRRGRADRHFEVCFDSADARPSDVCHVRIDRVSPGRTHGTLLDGRGTAPAMPTRSG